ncbi:S41 family peptidase, partial [candidate division KSB1 bacterium]
MKKRLFFFVFFILITGFIFNAVITAQEQYDPEMIFEAVWKAFDQNYGAFIPKKVDWNLLYQVYRPKVTPLTTDDELFNIIGAMLKHLNDNHVSLRGDNDRRIGAGITSDLQRGDFSLDLVKEKYLKGKFEIRLGSEERPLFHYGWITDEIGYFHFRNFTGIEESAAVVDEIIAEFQGAKGIIMDIRNNGGGSDRVAKAIGDRFADTKRLYMYSHIRNGPEHDDFTPPRYWHLEPAGPIQFLKPVVLMTNRFSISAADCFALGMRALPHVTNVGIATSGAYSDTYRETLPNGWTVVMGNKLYFDHEGLGWEGIGTPPDLRVFNTTGEIEQGFDKALEFAIDILNSGPIPMQDEKTSILNARKSLANDIEKMIESIGIDAAIRSIERELKPRQHIIRPPEFDQTRNTPGITIAGDPDSYYIDLEELELLAEKLLGSNRIQEAFEVLKIGIK